MTNFDLFARVQDFASFTEPAVSAERIYRIDTAACVLNCRRAMEAAVKWMYSVDRALAMPYQDNLVSLISTDEFRDIVDDSLLRRMDFIRKTGNAAAHAGRKITREQAALCLENLFIFLDFVAYCYAEDYREGTFDPSLLEQEAPAAAPVIDTETERKLEELIQENAALREELTARRAEQQQTYVPKPLDISEYKTRKLYIDAMLEDAGWTKGRNWFDEYEISGVPNKSETGYADYVLTGDDGGILAVIEAKRTCVDVAKGRQQAKLYADLIEQKQGRRPVVFLTNGFDTRIVDNQYPERQVAAFHSKRDLEKLFNLQRMRSGLKNIVVDKAIADRYYQEAAIKAVCDSFGQKNRRKALLVMATGSGKTRTVIALVKVLLEQGWIKNVLFLADRNSLVTQARRSFVNLLPDLSVTNLCEEKDNYAAHGVFSTYQTMMNCIDSVRDEEGKLFSCGHFDLVICDEAHRSIYNKYKDIFNYFDAPLVGLTATPKDEIDKNTYAVFELESGVPTYGYELAQAVQDGYLVDFLSVETKLKFIQEGIVYDDLSDEDKETYENTFEDENGELPESIASSALNEWIFNEDTIREALYILMTHGLKIDYGNKMGKTILFAKNHTHAENILEGFEKEYPHLNGCARVIDNYMTYAQSAIDEFSDPKKLPQIAISVDMLDTGIDVPEVLNLVFFKKVMSKAKFWQMIGRGTRRCPGLIDGVDKGKFYIFDFCGNFEFFRMSKGKPTANRIALQGAIFGLQFEIAYKLQDLQYQTERLIAYRSALVEHMTGKVRELNRENFAVRQHLRYVDRYAVSENYQALTYEDTLVVREELAPLIEPEDDDPKALRFDALMYGIELAYLAGKKYNRARHDLLQKVAAVASVANIPEIMMQAELIDKVLHTDYLDHAGIDEFEHIRKGLRDLMKYIPVGKIIYDTDFDDEILSVDWKESELENDDLKNYKAKAEYFVRQHQDHEVIAKLKSNVPLTGADVKVLEEILWSEVGTKQEYEAEYGTKPLGEFVREIVGLDMNAAKAAFAEFLNDTNLDGRQIYFVNQIVEYIVHNGMMKDLSVLQDTPFTDQGSIVEVFTDLTVWKGIRRVIEQVNANALAA
ncbi:DEAD/DEAH box helicase family protein [Fretibacterium fastidiosum]|uniref:Type I site-specific restriction-modification system, R (Restriction) subunit and related helicases n=1 Tax=Fretibacterium fastidiosum TaxID=651822 RepID=A0AB94IYM1_9BACT|nr:DEAD/DEAH box helicase family protein [Fretibacterium fastidiosum]CBL28764.1 Type I site-specific restriction-modification system, R (restriction) subunit and related helicases [Fretibacterium fastidiosum]